MNREKQSLLDMLNCACLALQYCQGKTRDEFYADSYFQDAVIRRIEIIGEAARRISLITQQKLPDIPWQDVISMRNVLIHEYHDVSIRIVWETIESDLPSLISALEEAIANFDQLIND